MADYLIIRYDQPTFPATRGEIDMEEQTGHPAVTGTSATNALSNWFNALDQSAQAVVRGNDNNFLIIELGDAYGISADAQNPSTTTEETYPA